MKLRGLILVTLFYMVAEQVVKGKIHFLRKYVVAVKLSAVVPTPVPAEWSATHRGQNSLHACGASVGYIDGGVRYVDGGVAFSDGGTRLVDGGSMLADGGVNFIDGNKVDGGVVTADGGGVRGWVARYLLMLVRNRLTAGFHSWTVVRFVSTAVSALLIVVFVLMAASLSSTAESAG